MGTKASATLIMRAGLRTRIGISSTKLYLALCKLQYHLVLFVTRTSRILLACMMRQSVQSYKQTGRLSKSCMCHIPRKPINIQDNTNFMLGSMTQLLDCGHSRRTIPACQPAIHLSPAHGASMAAMSLWRRRRTKSEQV